MDLPSFSSLAIVADAIAVKLCGWNHVVASILFDAFYIELMISECQINCTLLGDNRVERRIAKFTVICAADQPTLLCRNEFDIGHLDEQAEIGIFDRDLHVRVSLRPW
jgi:hypothetical protein